jgi:hypothetical protein
MELAAYPTALPTFDRGALERRVRGKLAEWRGLLTRDVVAGNATLRALLAEPIRFTPVREERRVGYRFEGRIALDRVILGLIPHIGVHKLVTSPAGFDMLCNETRREGFVRAA